MFSLNRAEIIGNVTRDPEMRFTPNGQAVCSFGIATNRRWRDKEGNNQEQTEFHNVVAWGKLAELMSQYVKKGNKIYIQGRLQTRSWEGQDGGKRNRTEIVMEDFVFLAPKGEVASKPVAADSGDEKEVVIEEFPAEDEPKAKTKAPTSAESESRPEGVGKEPVKDKKKAEEEDDINLDEIPF